MRVKICGITNRADALLAVSLGADALGFLIGLSHATDDEVSPEKARSLVEEIPPFITTVLVTHRTDLPWIVQTCQKVGCSAVQLHGPFPFREAEQLRAALPYLKIIKTIHVQGETSLARAVGIAPFFDAILLDTAAGGRIGGTGKTHDWSISAKVVENLQKPVILAGGLNPENVHDAIIQVRPFAVDVNSGVELPGGKKSGNRIKEFILRARQALREVDQLERMV